LSGEKWNNPASLLMAGRVVLQNKKPKTIFRLEYILKYCFDIFFNKLFVMSNNFYIFAMTNNLLTKLLKK